MSEKHHGLKEEKKQIKKEISYSIFYSATYFDVILELNIRLFPSKTEQGLVSIRLFIKDGN